VLKPYGLIKKFSQRLDSKVLMFALAMNAWRQGA